MILQREKLYSAEELWEMIQLPENDDKQLDFEDAVLIDIGISSCLNTVTGSRINYFLNAFVIPNDLGFVTGADAGFVLKVTGRVRRPDTAFVSKKQVSH